MKFTYLFIAFIFVSVFSARAEVPRVLNVFVDEKRQELAINYDSGIGRTLFLRTKKFIVTTHHRIECRMGCPVNLDIDSPGFFFLAHGRYYLASIRWEDPDGLLDRSAFSFSQDDNKLQLVMDLEKMSQNPKYQVTKY